jgi:ssDNA-binding Zn-finger/Zn-ribbon topoisomerase 1
VSWKFAEDEAILEALRRALEGRKTMCSQRELREKVLRELKKANPALTATGPRIRRLAITSRLAHVDIQWRETDRKTARFHCPVCGSQLKATKNETVFGGTVTLGFYCPVCPFRTTVRRKEPTRYTFTRKGE